MRAGPAILAAALFVAACTAETGPSGSPAQATPAAEGTALANCQREMRLRGAGTVRITKVTIFEAQRGIIEGRDAFRNGYTCFTNPQGDAVNVIVDRRRWL